MPEPWLWPNEISLHTKNERIAARRCGCVENKYSAGPPEARGSGLHCRPPIGCMSVHSGCMPVHKRPHASQCVQSVDAKHAEPGIIIHHRKQ